MKNTHNWKVVAYDEDDNIIDSWMITDRTENEAENEAIADMPYNMEDWTMVKQ